MQGPIFFHIKKDFFENAYINLLTNKTVMNPFYLILIPGQSKQSLYCGMSW